MQTQTKLELFDQKPEPPKMLPAPGGKELQVVEEEITDPPEQPHIAEIRKKPAAILKGIHFSIHTPTEERLTYQIEGLSPDVFRQIGFQVEDWSKVVDDKHKVKSTRGRGWKGRGKRITPTERVRVIRFSPFPSAFSNVLRTVRRELYDILHENCLVLEGETHGGYKQNIYILPYANAPNVMRAIQQQDREITELNNKIVKFTQSKEFSDLQVMLRKFNVELRANGHWQVEHISFDATPLALEPDTVERMVAQEYQQRFANMKDKLNAQEETLYRQGMDALNAELERRSQELVVKGIENIKKRIDAIVKRISQTRKKPEKIKQDIEQLHNLAMSVGLNDIALNVIEPLSRVAEHPEKVAEIFGNSNLTEAIDGRIKGLLANL